MGDDPLPPWRQVLIFFAVSEFNGQCFKVFINLREGFGDR